MSEAKILLLDIETKPMTAVVWGLFDQNISPNHIVDSAGVLCYAYKWLGQKGVTFDSVHQSKPKEMLKGIHNAINEADAIITYNGRRFDLPVLNREFLLNGFLPTSKHKDIDLLQTMRRKFKFSSNKLDFICQSLGLGKKTEHTGMQLWLDCIAGDPKAWKLMEKYNKNDVIIMESLYYKVLPWISNNINHNLFTQEEVCPSCGGKHLQKRGTAVSTVGTYQRYQCRDCGSWSQGTKAVKPSITIKGA